MLRSVNQKDNLYLCRMQERTTTVKDFFNKLEERLGKFLPEMEVRQHAFWLLEALYGKKRTDLLVDSPLRLETETQEKLEEVLYRLEKQEPIQYVLGEAPFYGRSFGVNPSVLIPRPETEELVQLILSRHGQQKGLRILDVGTGSGIIAISLALELKEPQVYAVDVSQSALEVAEENAHKLAASVQFIQTDVLATVPPVPPLDLVVSNPPYVRWQEAEQMQANVLDWEPHLALFVENHDPLIFYRHIAIMARQQLIKGGALYFEINEAYGQEVLQMLKDFGFTRLSVHQDMQRKDRMVSAEKPGAN